MTSTPAWRSNGMPALIAVTVAGFSGYAALIAVAPLWAVRGGAGPGGAGLVNAVLLLATVIAQFFVPAALTRFGHGLVLAAGLVLLGLPSLAYALSDQLLPILVLSALRGIGFAVLTVAGSAITARLVPPERLGSAVGAYGLAVAAPMIVLLPASVPIFEDVAPIAAFALGALPLLGVPAAFPVGRRVDGLVEAAPGRPAGTRWAGLSELSGHLVRPVAILLSVTMIGGALQTFLPQQIESSRAAALTLLVLTLATAVARWRAGAWADRAGPRPFLLPLLLATAVSTAAIAVWVRATDPGIGWLLTAVVVVGIGYGALQNLTLVVAFQSVGPHRINQASAGWNMGFDGGTAFGSLLTGYLASGFSFPVAYFALAAVALVAALAVHGIATTRIG